MSQTGTNTTEARPQQAAAAAGADATAHGKHRGQAAPDDTQAPPHGRHRRTDETAAS
ncbi:MULTISPECIES: hypothetical protein [unclassified Streptomyces]|uniref:hypothetical protein n=1 Tax=unclassified Streptomyces TaxID=2593676 RepID=UPI003369E000